MLYLLNQFLKKTFVTLILVTFLSGCATVGEEYPAMYVADIKIGQTTREDIQKLFGEPWRKGLEDGEHTWTYGHYQYSLFQSDKSSDLVIRFDDQGKVSSYTHNTTNQKKKNR